MDRFFKAQVIDGDIVGRRAFAATAASCTGRYGPVPWEAAGRRSATQGHAQGSVSGIPEWGWARPYPLAPRPMVTPRRHRLERLKIERQNALASIVDSRLVPLFAVAMP